MRPSSRAVLFIGGLLLPATLALDIASASQYNDAMRDTAWVAAAEAEMVGPSSDSISVQ